MESPYMNSKHLFHVCLKAVELNYGFFLNKVATSALINIKGIIRIL